MGLFKWSTFFAFCLLLVKSSTGQKPPFWKKAETARWLAHQNVWGTLCTTSLHLGKQAWGQPKSFVDGTIANSTGTPYFYDSDMDESVKVRTFLVSQNHCNSLVRMQARIPVWH